MREVQERVRQEVAKAIVDTGRADGVALDGDGVAFATQPELSVVNAPIAGLKEIDFRLMLEGRVVLDRTPVMYWYLAGEILRDKGFPLSEGFYTVVADQQCGTVGLTNAAGETMASGTLDLCIEPQGT